MAVHSACGLQQPACMFLLITFFFTVFNRITHKSTYVPSVDFKIRSINFVALSPGVYVCVEVDGWDFYNKQAKTHSSVQSLSPHWDQV